MEKMKDRGPELYWHSSEYWVMSFNGVGRDTLSFDSNVAVAICQSAYKAVRKLKEAEE